MLKIKPPNFRFCPFCGQKLRIRLEEERQRKYCSSCQWTYYPHVAGAVGGIITKSSKVLLVKRARAPYKNTWMFPAGFIDFGEHPLETLTREVKEETGLKVKKVRLVEILQSKDDPRSPGHLLFFFKVEVDEGQLATDQDENQAIGWKEIKKPGKIGWQSHRLMMKKLQEGKI